MRYRLPLGPFRTPAGFVQQGYVQSCVTLTAERVAFLVTGFHWVGRLKGNSLGRSEAQLRSFRSHALPPSIGTVRNTNRICSAFPWKVAWSINEKSPTHAVVRWALGCRLSCSGFRLPSTTSTCSNFPFGWASNRSFGWSAECSVCSGLPAGSWRKRTDWQTRNVSLWAPRPERTSVR